MPDADPVYTAKVFNGFIYLFDRDNNPVQNNRGIVRRWPFQEEQFIEDQVMSLDPSKANYVALNDAEEA